MSPKPDVPPWDEFAHLARPERRDISVADLILLADWRRKERVRRCGGTDPLQCLVAYAQDSLIYRDGKLAEAKSRAQYDALHRDERLNKFGLAYRADAPLLTHRAFADILVETAIDLYLTQGWVFAVFDSLRTIEAGYLAYRNAHPDDRASGLLPPPGRSAHNRALAADSMCFTADGREVEMGGHFDHSDMVSNHRNYDGPLVSAAAQQNRLLRERALQRAALACGTLIAPLREEFWDDRMPGSPADLWRVLESIARCIGLRDARIEALKETLRDFTTREQASAAYEIFTAAWQSILSPHAARLREILGADAPPPLANFTFHEWFNPLYDRDLRPHGLHLASEILPG